MTISTDGFHQARQRRKNCFQWIKRNESKSRWPKSSEKIRRKCLKHRTFVHSVVLWTDSEPERWCNNFLIQTIFTKRFSNEFFTYQLAKSIQIWWMTQLLSAMKWSKICKWSISFASRHRLISIFSISFLFVFLSSFRSFFVLFFFLHNLNIAM